MTQKKKKNKKLATGTQRGRKYQPGASWMGKRASDKAMMSKEAKTK